MLPSAARMRSSAEFAATVRGGVRSGNAAVVVYARAAGDGQTKVGFVVSRAVGNAVTRNRVRRRLRHLSRERLSMTPDGTRLVVRALPLAATVPHLDDDLASAWTAALGKLAARTAQ